MIALFLSGTIALLLFICFGFFTTKLFSLESTSYEKILIGLIVVNTLTSSISIFTPISFQILIYFIVAAFLLLFYIKNELAELHKTILSNYHIVLFSSPFLLIGFSVALLEPSVFDSGLYHIQSIKWIEEYPTIPGLANLHHRFGFNPTVFNLSALTALTNLFHQELFSINYVLFLIFTIYVTHKLYHVIKYNGLNNYAIFYSIFFYVLLLLSTHISSPSPDFISATFLLFIFLRIIEIQYSNNKNTLHAFIPIILLSTYCIMAKLSTIPVAIVIIYIFYSYRSEWKQLLQISIGLFFICLPWFIKTIILTGWILYPFAGLDLFDVDWKVPTEVVEHLNAEIVGWARCPNDYYYEAAHMPFAKWIPIWWSGLTIYTKLLVIGSIVLPITIYIGQLFKIFPTKNLLNLVLITAFSGVCFWFFTAPDFRFGQIFILMGLCTPLLYLNPSFSLLKNQNSIQKQLLFTVICFLLLVKFTRNTYGFNAVKIVHAYSDNFITPAKINSANASFISEDIDGHKIYTALQDGRCFDHKLPCRPLFAASIELRGATLSTGFRPKRKK